MSVILPESGVSASPENVEDELDEENFDEEEEGTTYASDICDLISKYVCNPLELSTFAIGGELDSIPAVTVKDVGRIGYPLSTQQAAALINIATQAPFGKGTKTVVDTSVRRVWQIDHNLVTINPNWLAQSLPKLVADCCAKLGIDAVKMNVRANLYKMLLYEEGGHFKAHKDTEKELGMFGSLLVQLPAEHEGGSLVVTHSGTAKRFEFAADSGDKAFYTSFYADCEHTLEPVTKGLRLVLAFNLVRGVTASLASAAASASNRKGFEEALAVAAKQWCADADAVQKYVYPLAFEYTRTNVSFAGLKGSDAKALSLLQNVTDPTTNQKLFSVYLALVTKHVTGTSDEDGGYGYGRYGYGRGGGGGGMSADCDIETCYETDTWVGPHGAVDLGGLKVDFTREVITAEEDEEDEEACCEGIFGDDPDETEEEGYQGNYAGSIEYWYHGAVLVFWPAQRDFDIKLSASTAQAIALLQGMDRTSQDFKDKLGRVLLHLQRHRDVSYDSYSSYNSYGAYGADKSAVWSVHSVLPLTQNLQQAKVVINLGSKKVLQEADVRTVIAAVAQHGLPALVGEFTALLRSQSLRTAVLLLDLVREHCVAQDDSGASHAGSSSSSSATAATAAAATAASTASAVSTGPQPASWPDLVQVFLSRVMEGTSAAMTAMPDGELVSVVDFVTLNCDLANQAAVANALCTKCALRQLNHVITHASPHGQQPGGLVDVLKQHAVTACNAPQSPADVLAVVSWIITGEHPALMATLTPRLRTLCNSPDLFRALFALPSVTAELKRDTEVSRHLESLVQARIDAVAPHTAPPAFSWCMRGIANTTGKPEVTTFLTSPLQQTVISGFTGIGHARNWASKYFGHGYGSGAGALSCIRAATAGTGHRATVTLTKLQSHHDAQVKRCADNQAEVARLRKMLLVRGAPGASGSAGSTAAGAASDAGQAQEPVLKKSRSSEAEVIVID